MKSVRKNSTWNLSKAILYASPQKRRKSRFQAEKNYRRTNSDTKWRSTEVAPQLSRSSLPRNDFNLSRGSEIYCRRKDVMMQSMC